MVLSQKFVERVVPGTKRLQISDDETTGFGLRVAVKGKKSFYFYAKVNGQERFKSLGEWPGTDVKAARDAAREWSGKAAAWKREGCPPDKDPFQKPAKQARSRTPVFRELVEDYIQKVLLNPNPKIGALNKKRAEYDVRLLVKNHFKSWLDVPIDRITVDHVLTAKNAAKGNYIQNSVVEFARRVFNWCAGTTNTKTNFWKVGNPAEGVALNDREKRKRYLGEGDPAELVRFWDALATEPHVETRDILTLLLATGARKSNVYEMKWADIPNGHTKWHVPMSKSGQGYTVELTPKAIEVVERRRKEKEEKAIWVFPANSMSGHVSDIKKRWAQFRVRAGIPDVRLHDLRRTKGSWAAISGESLQKIGAMLGHKSQGSTEIYAHLNQPAIRETSMASDKIMEFEMKKAKKRLKAAQRKAPKLLA